MGFPIILQHDSSQCGIASLLMICKYYGFSMSLQEGSKYCIANQSGVSLTQIIEFANSLGFDTFAGKYNSEQIHNIKLPCILHWNNNHFVVLYKISKSNTFYISDPAIGQVRYSKEEFISHWLKNEQCFSYGVALELRCSEIFPNPKYSTSYQKRDFKFILNYLKQYKHTYAVILLSVAIGTVLQLIFPYLTQWIVDKGIAYKDINLIWLILGGEMVIIIAQTITNYIRKWLLMHISLRINISLILDFFNKLLKLPISFFEQRQSGDILQRIADHERVQLFLIGDFLGALFGFVSIMVFGIILFLYNSSIFFIFLFFGILYAGWTAIFLKKRKLLDYEMFEANGNLQGKTYQFVSAISEIILQGCKQRRCNEWKIDQQTAFDIKLKMLHIHQIQEGGLIFLNELKNVFITILSAIEVIEGNLSLGEMLAIQYIVGQLNSPILQLISFIMSCQDIKLSLERINSIHQEPELHGDIVLSSQELKYSDIIFQNVSFSYGGSKGHNVLNNINIVIPHGKTTAIVGSSGSGKTSLLKLLVGAHDVSKGVITIGGIDMKNINLDWWHRNCGIVMQESILFSESIARNIAIEDGKYNKRKVCEAALFANIENFIKSLPEQYDTKIGPDGIGVSQGQKQRILIARAVYKEAPIMIFDEATNSLDAQNEKDIIHNLDGILHGRTSIIVAHRLSTIMHADQIIVMKDGHVKEIGVHKKLMERKGIYYSLIKNQLFS